MRYLARMAKHPDKPDDLKLSLSKTGLGSFFERNFPLFTFPEGEVVASFLTHYP